ncbi:urea transporter [Thalassobacillus devorans]|uniref:urea transporter n=1 Tax=Thalassobacillus devorans TaxID=279813 RepID=UPI0006867E23|nr:urea transporter [Thalassobacillus devorans]
MQNKTSKSVISWCMYVINLSMKGVSQVVLIENAVTGIIILTGITVASFSLGVIAFISAMLGTLIGLYGGAEDSAKSGLFGFNSVLAGLSLFLFLEVPNKWSIALIGAVLAAVFTAGIMHILGTFEIPALTFPFIMVTWMFLLAGYQFTSLTLSKDLVPQDLSSWKIATTDNPSLVNGIIRGVGQVFFQDFFWTGIIIIIGIFWAGWKFGVYTILGTTLASWAAYTMGADIHTLNLGLYGYNAVLTVIAVSLVFDEKRKLAPVTGIIGAILSVPVTAAVHTVLIPYGLPVLTLPFVLTTWTLLAARKVTIKL